ncbi:hypothetical protein AM593_01436, partial [Mytilus galloprovincialis]
MMSSSNFTEKKFKSQDREGGKNTFRFCQLSLTQTAKMRILTASLLFFLFAVSITEAEKCEGKRDIVFLLDMSGSVGEYNFRTTMLNTVAKISNNFYIGPYNTQIGVDVFSTSAKTSIKLKDYRNGYSLNRAIRRIKYEGGYTNTYLGLNHVRRHSLSYRYGHRSGVPRIAIVLTDGKSQHKSKTLTAARNLKYAGVKIFSVGIGYGIDWAEVHGIASYGRKRAAQKLSLMVQNFKELNTSSFRHRITNMACNVGSFIKRKPLPQLRPSKFKGLISKI